MISVSVPLATVAPMAGVMGAWNPWRALRERAATILVWRHLGGHQGAVRVIDGVEEISLDPQLGRRDRSAVLGHELVHLERGILPPGTPDLDVIREERRVTDEAAARMLPLEPLALWVARRSECEPITVQLTADEFDVATIVAERSLAQLRHPRSGWIRLAAERQVELERRGGAA